MRRAAPALIALLALLLPAAPAAALDRDALARSLDRQLRQAGPASGALAVDLDTGQTLYARRSGTRRVPASVTKLFTAAAVLRRLGPDARLSTRVMAPAAPDPTGTVDGDLRLVGGGDPTLGPDDVARLARAVARAGVQRVTGTVTGDETLFDRLRGTPYSGWRSHFENGGVLGALVYRGGWERRRMVAEPAQAAAAALRRALVRRGVEVGKRSREAGAPAARPPVLATVTSPTMTALVRRMNVVSDNYVAEMLLKGLGAQRFGRGTTSGGARVVRAALADWDVGPRLVDGSGLSRGNRTTPREVVRLLRHAAEDPAVADPFRASLAVAGRSGTVRKRMRRTPAAERCQVKTGTLNAVSTLAGYCETRAGGQVAFAWLMDGVSPYGARRLQDRMTVALTRYVAPDGAGEPVR